MLNKIFLQGRLVADPELKHTPNGVAVASFTLAVEHDFKSKSTGEKGVDFINIVVWRQTAEFVSRFFSKGRLAIVDGRLQIRSYTDRDGNKRTIAEVVADNVYFGDSRKDAEGGGGYSAPNASIASPYSTPADGGYIPSSNGGDQFAEITESDGDLPF